ncbi:hypothetical protein [Aeromonas veronii]|uniref:hypothetical protein n=1 Tax=Aeromonas veronii TaxID=654 RepID=UPI000EB411CE|nr:hypothetical protein [Aeromonas veronii]AYK19199.1 hypothetical protein C0073_016160 [Aeromonas veronii]
MARTLDEILTTEMPDVVTQAREKAEQMRLEVHMSHLREMLTKAGTEPMICDQAPSLQDVTLMDLKRWVEAAGENYSSMLKCQTDLRSRLPFN